MNDEKSVIQGFTEHLELAKKPVKVLLVDDYEADRILEGMVFKQLGYAYDEAKDGVAALQMMSLNLTSNQSGRVTSIQTWRQSALRHRVFI